MKRQLRHWQERAQVLTVLAIGCESGCIKACEAGLRWYIKVNKSRE
jgi:hypothetical protein